MSFLDEIKRSALSQAVEWIIAKSKDPATWDTLEKDILEFSDFVIKMTPAVEVVATAAGKPEIAAGAALASDAAKATEAALDDSQDSQTRAQSAVQAVGDVKQM